MALEWPLREQIIDEIIDYKKRGYPIMNSVSGLKLMRHNQFPKDCWVSNFTVPSLRNVRVKAPPFATSAVFAWPGKCGVFSP